MCARAMHLLAPGCRCPRERARGVRAEHAVEIVVVEPAHPHAEDLDRRMVERNIRAVKDTLDADAVGCLLIFVCMGIPDVSR